MTAIAPKPVVSQAAADHAAVVSARRLGKVIDDKAILSELGFDIPAGRFVTLLGANGAGKSTLLKMLATLIPASTGELRLFGERVVRTTTAIRSRLGLIGHGAMLYRELSALENLVFYGRLYALRDPVGRARELLGYVDLSTRERDPVRTFSRGMVQRVAIARALMHRPELLLADEPFAGLDAPSCRMLETLLRRLHEEGHTIVLANHDIGQSLDLAEHAIVLRRGRIVTDRATAQLDADSVLAEITTS